MKINFKEITPNPFHPTIPDEYRNETDYRKIPNEYLEKNIPKGRGMIKWVPFASTPKLYDYINKMIKSQDDKIKPDLTDEQIYLNSIHLSHQMTMRNKCRIKYFEQNNIIYINGIINKMDTNSGIISVQLIDTDIIKSLKFIDIIEVESVK